MTASETVVLAYGQEGLSFEIPRANLCAVCEPRPMDPVPSVSAAVTQAIGHPSQAAPLAELAREANSAVVVISDQTRPVPNREIIPVILGELILAGIQAGQIRILIGTGMHRQLTDAEVMALVGAEIAAEFQVLNHDGYDLQSHADLGHTAEGVPILIDRRYLEADLRITVGLVEPHLLAGFSGGRKAICPGICSLETIKVLHGYRMLEHPGSRLANLENNPFHRAALEVARMARVDFSLNITLNNRREVSGVFAGDLEKAHAQAVDRVRTHASVNLKEPVDVVVTCGGGDPLDRTLYQSFKGLAAAIPILKPGGSLVLAAAIPEGVGSESFRSLMWDFGSPEEYLACLAGPDYRAPDQWMGQHYAHILKYAGEVHLFTPGLPEAWYERLLANKVGLVGGLWEHLLRVHGSEAKVAVIPAGPYTLVGMDTNN